MSINKEYIQGLNKKAQELNSNRQMQLGRKESAQQAYDKAVAMYKQQYGVDITPENLQEIYNNVVSELNTQAQELERKIADVDNQANQAVSAPVGGIDTTVPVQPQTVEQPVIHTTVPTDTVGTVQTGAFVQPQAPVQPEPQPQVQPQVAPQQPSPTIDFQSQLSQLAATVQATPVTNPNIPNGDSDIEDTPVSPAGWGTPSSDVNSVFDNILNNK